MREISLGHAVAQSSLLGYKRKKKSVASSSTSLIDIDPVLKVNIKRNDAVAGWSLSIQVRVTHGACVTKKAENVYEAIPVPTFSSSTTCHGRCY